LALENLALRQQVAVWKVRQPRPYLAPTYRIVSKPRRCHRTTVSGRTTCGQASQFVHSVDRTTQKIRSVGAKWARLAHLPHGDLLSQCEVFQR